VQSSSFQNRSIITYCSKESVLRLICEEPRLLQSLGEL
jgi:hypothetical protein